MSTRQIRVRAAVRFLVLTATVGVWFLLSHLAVAGIALAVGL